MTTLLDLFIRLVNISVLHRIYFYSVELFSGFKSYLMQILSVIFQAQTFGQVIEADISESEEKSITALGLLNTMETILTVMEDQKEVYYWIKN